MSREINERDCLIIGDEEHPGKFHLATVTKIEGSEYEVLRINRTVMYPELRVYETISIDDVVVNLGPTPPFGKVYGTTAQPYIKEIPVKGWGHLHLFRHLTRTEKENIKTALKRVRKDLKRVNAHKFMPIHLAVVENSGKKVGEYRHMGKKNLIDTLTLMLPDYREEKPIVQTLRHEAGHGVWFRGMPRPYKARWIMLYERYMNLVAISPAKIKKIARDLDKHGGVFELRKLYRGDRTDGEVGNWDILQEICKYIKKHHHLSVDHLDILVTTGKDIQEFLPESGLEMTEAKQVLTDYARKSPEEFFSEAFMLYFEKKLPKTVKKLMVSTLSNLKFEIPETEEEEE